MYTVRQEWVGKIRTGDNCLWPVVLILNTSMPYSCVPTLLILTTSMPRSCDYRAAESVAAQQRRCELSKGLVSRARML